MAFKHATMAARRLQAHWPIAQLVSNAQWISFWITSGGEDLDRIDPTHLSFRTVSGRAVVNPTLFSASPATAVILAIGQSNIANECDPFALRKPEGEVFNFNFFDGRCYEACDPLLGASVDRSNVLTRVGELLVTRGNYRRILLVPIAHGGTFAREWAPGGQMFPRLERALKRLKERNIAITHIVWQQGESEAAERDPKPLEWMNHLRATIDAGAQQWITRLVAPAIEKIKVKNLALRLMARTRIALVGDVGLTDGENDCSSLVCRE